MIRSNIPKGNANQELRFKKFIKPQQSSDGSLLAAYQPISEQVIKRIERKAVLHLQLWKANFSSVTSLVVRVVLLMVFSSAAQWHVLGAPFLV